MEQIIKANPNSIPASVQTPPSGSLPVLKKINISSSKNGLILAVVAIAVILLGVGVGKILSGSGGLGGGDNKIAAPGAKQTASEAGRDSEECNTEAEGKLEEGGIDGEGTHKLVRSADVSKNVYLGSTVIDLQTFVGKKVKVTGQTISGKKAGWLMDVCKIKVTE